mgnify:CR=1 FL=1
MKKDYKNIAKQIVEGVGGKDNINDLTQCTTRLRFSLVDESLADDEKLQAVDSVVSIVKNSGQYQVVIGNEVGHVYKAIANVVGENNSETSYSAGKQKPDNNKKWYNKIIDTITSIMTPMIPALTAAGMVKAILSLINELNIIGGDSSTYKILDIIGDSAFYFMPFLIAVNAAKVFRVSTSLAVLVTGVLLHPELTALFESGEAVTFIGLTVPSNIYAASVIPVLLTVWLMSYIERIVERIVPSVLEIILKPTLILLITAPLALIVIGPLGNYAGEGLGFIIELLEGRLGFIMIAFLAAVFPLIVMTGMHHALTPILLSTFAATGQEGLILIAQICSNLAHGGATLAVAVKTKSRAMKQVASASGISAIMGITEPALYGVTLKLKRPLVAAGIGAGIAGAFAGIMNVVVYVPLNNIIAAGAFSGEKGLSNIVAGLIMMFSAFVIAFIATYLLGFKDEEGI